MFSYPVPKVCKPIPSHVIKGGLRSIGKQQLVDTSEGTKDTGAVPVTSVTSHTSM